MDNTKLNPMEDAIALLNNVAAIAINMLDADGKPKTGDTLNMAVKGIEAAYLASRATDAPAQGEQMPVASIKAACYRVDWTSSEPAGPMLMAAMKAEIADLRAALAASPVAADKPDTSQDWAKLDGATAFHLIERHADDWAETGRMMEAWGKARFGQVAADKPVVPRGVAKLLEKLRDEGVLSEGQITKALGVDILTCREILDGSYAAPVAASADINECTSTGVVGQTCANLAINADSADAAPAGAVAGDLVASDNAVRNAALEEAAKEADHWQQINTSHKCGQYIAGAIRALKSAAAEVTPAPATMPDWLSYDKRADILTIHGIRYSGELMRELGGLLPVDKPFVIKGRQDGVLVIYKPEAAPATAAGSVPDDVARDAKRYRWIESKAWRDGRDGGHWGYYVLPNVVAWGEARGKRPRPFNHQTLGAAIDAAAADASAEGGKEKA